MTKITLNYDNVDITSAALELFWREYRWKNREWYRSIDGYKKLFSRTPAITEYRFYADGRDFNAIQQQISILYAAITLESSDNEQTVSLHHTLENNHGQHECVLSEDSARRDAEEMFVAFTVYLQEEECYIEFSAMYPDEHIVKVMSHKFSDDLAHTLRASAITDLVATNALESDVDSALVDKTLSKTHRSGWTITGKLETDHYVFVNNFTARYGQFGVVKINNKIVANSQEVLDNFLRCHPLETWDWGNI